MDFEKFYSEIRGIITLLNEANPPDGSPEAILRDDLVACVETYEKEK